MMNNLFLRLLHDEHGFVLSAESMLLGTVGVIGATVGLSAAANSVNDELTDVAMAIRSVDQSFHIDGDSNCGACIAGSTFHQTPVKESLKQLRHDIETAKAKEQKLLEEAQKSEQKASNQKLETSGEKPEKNRKKHRKNKERLKNEQGKAPAVDQPVSETPATEQPQEQKTDVAA